MTMQIRNKVGLEAEFLLRDKKGNLVFPGDFGFETDEYEILGELRAEAGFTRHEAVANFVKEIIRVTIEAATAGLVVDFTGWTQISADKKAEITRRVGAKYVPPCDNIYKTDILSLSDDVVNKKGQIVGSRISAGLHIHFSRRAYYENIVFFGKNNVKVSDSVSILTYNQIKAIIRHLDRTLLPLNKLPVNLKYRAPGFYEMKDWGFEYRSLPMTPKFTELKGIQEIVDRAFSELEDLS